MPCDIVSLCLQDVVLTKDFTVPLTKESFKTTLEAYSIGMQASGGPKNL